MGLIWQIIDSLPDKAGYALVEQIHGHFYYGRNLLNEASELIPLTLPTRLQKEKVEVFVGDVVQFDSYDQTVKSVVPRQSLLPRPKVANIDQAVIVVAATNPPLEPEHLDRLLCHAGLTTPSPPIVCLTKIDLEPYPEVLKQYEKFNYPIVPICNKSGVGVDRLEHLLGHKMSVLAGSSGVGKSSLLNSISPQFSLKVGEVSQKSTRGTHTTRHTQIFKVKNFYLLDTPGFSRLDAQTSQVEICSEKAFPEIGYTGEACAFPDCKHLDEEGCKVEFSESRKASYRKLMEEARRWEDEQLQSKKEKARRQSKKQDSTVNIPLLKGSLRAESRKSFKQNFDLEEEKEELGCEGNEEYS